MKKKNKNEIWNLIFSAFLVTAFLICSYFFLGIVHDSFALEKVKEVLFNGLIFALFGALLFYATRVGDGKQVWRFSPATLVLMVLPALYIVLATAIGGLPWHDPLSARPIVSYIAAAVFGYGVPYTFLSGFELNSAEQTDADPNAADTEAAEETDTSDNEAADNAAKEAAKAEEPSDNAAAEDAAEAEEAIDDNTADAATAAEDTNK